MNVYDLLSGDNLWGIISLRRMERPAKTDSHITQSPEKTELVSKFQSQMNTVRGQTGRLKADTYIPRTGSNSQSSEDTSSSMQVDEENWVAGEHICGRNDMQSIHAEYTADSTPEDPIVHIYGKSDSGAYDFTCHINDIDPTNASYAEMVALFGHLQKNGTYDITPGSSKGMVIPTGLEPGDVTRKQNFMNLIREQSTSKHFSPSIHTNARDLLRLYTSFMQNQISSSQGRLL